MIELRTRLHLEFLPLSIFTNACKTFLSIKSFSSLLFSSGGEPVEAGEVEVCLCLADDVGDVHALARHAGGGHVAEGRRPRVHLRNRYVITPWITPSVGSRINAPGEGEKYRMSGIGN